MPTGHVKVFDPEQKFGFIIASDGNEFYVAGDEVSGGALRSGDEVEFELQDSERGRTAAVGVKITKSAPEDSPVGRTMAAPPTWEELEERERQRRMARRRRR
ncbi:MAG: cold shock domain-containing protein [Nitriliruptoraceae bacterium]